MHFLSPPLYIDITDDGCAGGEIMKLELDSIISSELLGDFCSKPHGIL